jgi:hypothetical protein
MTHECSFNLPCKSSWPQLRSRYNKAAALFCALLLIPTLHAQVGTVSAHTGQQQASAAEVRVLSDVPQRPPMLAAAPGRFSGLRPYAGISEAEYQARKNQAANLTMDLKPASALTPSGAVGTQTPGVSTSFGGIEQSCSFFRPSDMAIAAGPVYVLQVVNNCMAVFSKSGVVQAGYPKSVNTFFGLPPNNFDTGQYTGDPRLVYDWVKNRYLLVMVWWDLPSSRGFLMVAASATSDPRGAWHIYRLQGGGTGTCPDFPTLGQAAWGDAALGAFAVGFNLFRCNTNGLFGGLVDDQVWFLPKGSLYGGFGFRFNLLLTPTLNGVLLDTIQPSNDQSLGDKPRAIFGVNSFNINFGGVQCRNGCNGLVLWAFSNVLVQPGSPGLEVSGKVLHTPSNYQLPPKASQPGGLNTIDTGDTRISGQVYYASGSLWATVTTNNGGGGPAVLAWQIHPTLDDNNPRCTGSFVNDCPRLNGGTIEQQISYAIGGGRTANAYYGTIVPDPERNLAMVFNFSGTSRFGSTAYVTNRVTNVAGHWHDAGNFLMTGRAFYGQGRWGDYTGVSNDLSSPTSPTLWFSGMFAQADGTWGTWIGRTGYRFSNQP